MTFQPKNIASVDAYLFSAATLWTKAAATYNQLCGDVASEDVTRDAANLVDEIEAGIRDFEAATVPGAMVKLRIVEEYLHELEGDDTRASAMALSFARDCSAIIRAPGTLPLRPLV